MTLLSQRIPCPNRFSTMAFRPQLTTFRINTCKSVSKQSTLTPFRMNTYEKQGGGGSPGRTRTLTRTPKRVPVTRSIVPRDHFSFIRRLLSCLVRPATSAVCESHVAQALACANHNSATILPTSRGVLSANTNPSDQGIFLSLALSFVLLRLLCVPAPANESDE